MIILFKTIFFLKILFIQYDQNYDASFVQYLGSRYLIIFSRQVNNTLNIKSSWSFNNMFL